MIYLLNETNSSWGLLTDKRGVGTELRFSKSEHLTSNTTVIRKVSLLLNRNIKLSATPIKLSTYRKMSNKLQPLMYKGSTFVQYDATSFMPIATTSSRDDQPFLLLSLPKEDDKAVRVSYNGAELLDFMVFKSEFAAVIRFKEGTEIKFAVRRSSATIVYTFKYTAAEGIKMKSEKVDSKDVERFSVRISKFRPNIPTELLLVAEDDLSAAKNLIQERYPRKKLELRTFSTSYDLERGLKDVMKKYNAVTLYCDTIHKNETKADKARYGIVGNLLEVCHTVQKLHKDGKISRVRVQ